MHQVDIDINSGYRESVYKQFLECPLFTCKIQLLHPPCPLSRPLIGAIEFLNQMNKEKWTKCQTLYHLFMRRNLTDKWLIFFMFITTRRAAVPVASVPERAGSGGAWGYLY